MKRRGLDLNGYILQDAVWEFYLNLVRAFSLLGRGVPGRKVAACAPKDGGAAMMERVKRYARENPDCPVALQELPGMMDAFTRLCMVADRPGVDAAKVRAWAAELQARCMGYHAGLGEAMKAEAEGAAMGAELDMEAEARARAVDAQNRAEAERDTWRTVAEGKIDKATAAAERAEKATREEGARTRDAVEAAEKKLAGQKRGLSSDAARLEAFKRFEATKKDEVGTQAEIAAGVLADMKEEGKDLHLDTRTFLNRWRDWTQMKRPGTVEEYRAAKDAAKKAKRAKAAKPAKAGGSTGRAHGPQDARRSEATA